MKKAVKNILRHSLSLFAPLFSKKSVIDEQTARSVLSDCSASPVGSAITNNTRMLPDTCDLQIIVPAYNVEKYLETCIQSVLSQKTKYTYRIVLIDDGATDMTPQIADRFATDARVTVIHQKNKGFSGARNTGLKTLFGKYIMFLDSDDCLCPGAIDALLDSAFQNDCDIVEGGAYYWSGEQTRICFRYEENKQLNTALGNLHGQPWAKVYKAECLEKLCFPEGFWFEDSFLSFLLYPTVKNVHVVKDMIYMYRQNGSGITATFKGRPKSIDSYWVTEAMMRDRARLGLANDAFLLEKFCRQIKLNYNRMSGMEEKVQECAFVLSCELLKNHFSPEILSGSKNALIKILLNKDWGAYKLYCRIP